MRRYCYSIFLICSIIVMATSNLLPNRHSTQPSSQEYIMEYTWEDSSEESVAELEQGETDVHKDFSDTLFIGDSRTVGLFEYGDLGQAVVFANSGMSVFNLLDAQVSLSGKDKQKLDQVLSSKSFKTIYLMLGINELGYDNHSIVRRYREVVDWIRAKQPEATLVLEANLHVTEEKSSKSDIYNNQKINALNDAIRSIAEETGCPYIDVNPIFDDENGNLSAAYSSDGAHVLGKYYSVWVDWIRGI